MKTRTSQSTYFNTGHREHRDIRNSPHHTKSFATDEHGKFGIYSVSTTSSAIEHTEIMLIAAAQSSPQMNGTFILLLTTKLTCGDRRSAGMSENPSRTSTHRLWRWSPCRTGCALRASGPGSTRRARTRARRQQQGVAIRHQTTESLSRTAFLPQTNCYMVLHNFSLA